MSEEESKIEQSGNPIEELATQYGWNPEGEKSAEEYVRVAMDKFPDQSKKIKQLFRTIDEIKTHMSKVETVAYDRAKKDIESQRKAAIKAGDVDLVEQLDEARAQLTSAPQPQVNDFSQYISEFEEKNSEWLQGTSLEQLKMQKWVQDMGAILGTKKLHPSEHMKKLDEAVRTEFAAYFSKDEEVKSPVASGESGNVSSKSTHKKNYSFKDLSEEQKQIARDFEQMGVMSVESYIKDLIKHGELK